MAGDPDAVSSNLEEDNGSLPAKKRPKLAAEAGSQNGDRETATSKELKSISPLEQILRRVRQQIQQLQSQGPLFHRPCVVHAKHLCGGATDLALYSLEQAGVRRLLTKKVGIATCCHHRCDWRTFVGKRFLENIVAKLVRKTEEGGNKSGVLPKLKNTFCTSQVFETLVKTASWAVVESGGENDVLLAKKQSFGIRCKRVLDIGRAWYCRDVLKIQNAFVCNYVPRTVSPENGLLLAF